MSIKDRNAMSKVSIIILAYGGAHLLGQTLESVLAQSYPNFELIVVDDASPDETGAVVQSYHDPRIRYLRHETNRGANQAWLTGLRAAEGDLIACLDQDDCFHPNKLAEHVKLYRERPGTGVSYNAHFVLLSPGNHLRGIWPAPLTVTLADLVLGFPFTPSDMVLRRDWALLDGLWDDDNTVVDGETIVNGAEYLYCGRLWYAGCEFVGLPQALNYRRYHSGRQWRNLLARCTSELRCQEIVLRDPRCPADVRALQPQAFRNTYLGFAHLAFAEGEVELGNTWLCAAAQCDPTILHGQPAPIVQSLAARIAPDESHDWATILPEVFAQLPADLAHLRAQQRWAVGRCHLLQGAKALMWGQPGKGAFHMQQALIHQAELDEALAYDLAYSLVIYEREVGVQAAEAVWQQWQGALRPLSRPRVMRRMAGSYLANRAIQRFRAGDYANVPTSVFQAFRQDRRYLRNRGLFAMIARSLYGVLWQRTA
jgi:hypothetical protein